MSPLPPLILATMFNIIGLGTVVPVLPLQTVALGGADGAAPLIFSAFSAAAVVSAPLWGWASDRIGRRPVLLASAGLTLISYLWLAVADGLLDLYGSRILAGLAAGWFAAAAAYVADVTGEADRAKGMGLLGAAFGVGFTIGPFMGGTLAGSEDPNFALPALTAAGFTGLCVLIALTLLKEPARHKAERPERFATGVLRDRRISLLLMLHFTIHLVFTAMEGVFAIWAAANFGLGVREVGFYLAFSGLITVLVQGGLVRVIVPKLGEARVLILAAALLAATMLSILAVQAPLMILIPMGLLALGIGLHNPSMQSLLSQTAPQDLKGGALGTAQSAQSMARIIGPAWGAAVFSAFGSDAPFMVGAAVLGGAFAFALFLAKRFPHRPAAAQDRV